MYPATHNVAEEFKCPHRRKVQMSVAVTTQHHDQPRSERQTRLQDQIGAGGALHFGFSFETRDRHVTPQRPAETEPSSVSQSPLDHS